MKYCPNTHLLGYVPSDGGGRLYEMRCGDDNIVAERIFTDTDDAGVMQWMRTTLRVHNIEWLLHTAVRTDGAPQKQWFLEHLARQLKITLPAHEAGVAP